MVKFVVGSGSNRQVIERAEHGKDMHVQRRAIKQYLGLLR